MNKWRKIVLLSTLGASALMMTACNEVKEDIDKESVVMEEKNPGMSIKPSDTETNEGNDLEIVTTHEPEVMDTEQIDEPGKIASYAPISEQLDYRFLKVKNTTKYEVDAHTGWEESPNKTQMATVDGRGEASIEEGLGTLVIRGVDSDRLITLADTDRQYTIKEVEWIDTNRLFVIVGMSYGTLTKGGQLYEVNLLDNTAKKIFPKLTEKEEITSISANGDGTFAYSVHTYTDDNFTTGYTEQKGLSPNY